MSVVAPSTDPQGALLDARIAAAQTLANSNANLRTLYQVQQLLNQLQVEAVNRYMVSYWLDASVILATYSAPAWDKAGQALTARVAFLQGLVNNPPVMPVGNAFGYGSSGWTTVLQNYQAQLYAAQVSLVERIMDVPGGTSAATILAGLTGFQSRPFEYKYAGVGFT